MFRRLIKKYNSFTFLS